MVFSNWFYVLLAVSFLVGSIPTAYLFVKRMKGIDIRTVGSGNVGATNAARVLGRPMGILILLLDALKGLAPTYLGAWALTKTMPWQIIAPEHQLIAIALGLCAFLGHCFTPWLKFKGGKGVATGLGVYLVLAPFAALTTLAICVIIIITTRLVSLAAITGAALLPFFILFYSFLPERKPVPWIILGFTVALCALVIVLHRSNIKRLLAGAESKA